MDFGNGVIITQQQAEYQSDGHYLDRPGLKRSDKNEKCYHIPPETTQNGSPHAWSSDDLEYLWKGFRAVM